MINNLKEITSGLLFLALFCLVIVLIGPISFSLGGVVLLSLKSWILLVSFLLPGIFIISKSESQNLIKNLLTLIIFFSLFIFISDWPNRGHAVLEGQRNPWLTFAVIASFAVTLYFISRSRLIYFSFLIPLSISFCFSYIFLKTLNFNLLFSDDHPTFLFRLISLKEAFPNIPSFNPLWNAGIEFRDYFASGALAIFLLFSPLIYLFDVIAVYNFLVIILLFFFPLLISWMICKLLHYDRKFYIIYSLLTLSSTTLWYRWALSYGTLGFILANQLLPFLAAVLLKLSLNNTKFHLYEIILYIALISIMLLWPISILFLFPCVVYIFFNFKAFAFNKTAWVIFISLLLLNLPWMLQFKEISNVENFISAKSNDPGETPINEALKTVKSTAKLLPENYLKTLRQTAQTANPLILFLGLPGLALLKCRKLSLLFSGLTLWLVFLATFGSSIKPQLELDRFAITAIYILALPATVAAVRIIEFPSSKKIPHAFYFMIPVLFIIAALYYPLRMLSNKTLNPFYGKAPIVDNLSSEISKHAGAGRTLFSGFILHELSNGHIAPLVYFSGKPLIARSYKHDHWEFHEVVPSRYLKQKGKRLEEFFDLYNVTSIVTLDRNWRDYYQARPALYKEVWHSQKFRIFKRIQAIESYFLQGSGEVLGQTGNKVIFKLNFPDAVLKYNYLERLKVEGCEVYPFHVEGPVTLTGLKSCPSGKELKMSF